MDNASECLDTIGAFNALWAHAGEQIQHPVVVLQVLKVRVDLADEAVRSATMAANQLSFWDSILVNPSWIASNFARRELCPRNQRISRLFSKAQSYVILIITCLLEVL